MPQQNKNNQLQVLKKDVFDVVSNKIKSYQTNQQLNLPKNYSPENAMKSAFLILQKTVDKNKKPVLSVCDRNSIANALLDMVVAGLNPAKNQCYFIAYGNQLTCQRSVYGTMAIAKNLCNVADVNAQVVWGDDVFEYQITKGNKVVTVHDQKIENIGKNPKAAYCMLTFANGSEFTDIMTMEQIKKSWSKSKMNPNNETSVHKEFSEEMIKKTVINRTLKPFINSSSDAGILVEHLKRSDDMQSEIEFSEEVKENANKEFIDINPEIDEKGADYNDKDNNPFLPKVEDISDQLTEEEKNAIIQQEIAESKANQGPDF